MARAFQQFSRFRLGKESVDATQHHLLQKDQVGQRREILEPLALELSKPAEGFAEAEETVGDVELVLGLLARAGDVQRPGGRDARLARLDELGDGDVDDALAAGLGAGDAEQAVDLTAGALARRAGKLVAKQRVV